MTAEITALMLYYGRRNVAEEAVESFLRQTYPHKRLIIVNTHPDPVHFNQERSEIEVHNIVPDPFENLNAKYNYAFSQIKTNWWCPWDSDDLWLPWHMENLAGNIPHGRHEDPWKVGVTKCYFHINGKFDRIGWNMWSNCIFETMDSQGRLHPKCDASLARNCDSQILLDVPWTRCWLLNKHPKSYIFRWDQSGHGSAVTGDDGPAHHAQCREKMYAIRNDEPFRPHWDHDYVAQVEEFNSKHDWRKSKYAKNQPTPKEQK